VINEAVVAASIADSTVGGGDLKIQTVGTSIVLSWSGGTSQTGYSIYRLGGGGLTLLPPNGPLGPSALGYTDATPPAGVNCYVAFPLGVDPGARSDLLCAAAGFHWPPNGPPGFTVPQNFTLDLNASSTAHLNWSGSGTNFPDSYLFAIFNADGSVQATPYIGLPPGIFALSEHRDMSMSGFSCYALGAVVDGQLLGYTDLLCALPGLTTLPPVVGPCTFHCISGSSADSRRA